MKKLSLFLIALIAMSSFSSCISTKKVAYFQNQDSVNVALSRQLYDAKIMPKDILQIRVFTTNPEAAEPFNLLQVARTTSSSQSSQTIPMVRPVFFSIHQPEFSI